MKGFRTIVINGLIAVTVALLTYVAGIDWTQYVSPTIALIITNVTAIGLRLVTNTAPFSKE